MIEALYLHIPFCVHRCAYCDFATSACDDGVLMDAYVDALSLAIRRASRAGLLGSLRTIYIGGGTPSYLGNRRLSSLVYLLSLSVNLEQVEEFTVEVNPDSLDAAMVRDLYALGVNRFSIGAQSFDDATLRTYGRVHDAAQIGQAVAQVRQRTDSFSLDLICGCPGQTIESWRADVVRAADTGAGHISVYPLTVEEGTPLARSIASGALPALDDDLQADMMVAAEELLTQRGLYRYEVSSYARPGCESRHNSAYWTGAEYLGLGAGAASMLSVESFGACAQAALFTAGDMSFELPGTCSRVRLASAFDIDAFVSSGGRPSAELECLTAREAMLEDAMLGMRMTQGISQGFVDEVAQVEPGLPQMLDHLQDVGLVTCANGRWAPTQRGWLCGNEVFSALWGLV